MALSARFNRGRAVNGLFPSAFDMLREVEELLQPWGEVGRGFGAGFDRPMDLYETDEAVVLELAVPGVKAEDLDVSVEGRQVTVRGRYGSTPEEEGRRYWLRGLTRGEFSRTVALPSGVLADAIEAHVADGVLTLRMPKAPEAVARKIAVKDGSQVKTLDAPPAHEQVAQATVQQTA